MLDRIGAHRGQEIPGRLDQCVHTARRTIGGDGGLHQPSNALDRIVLMRGILGQPQRRHAGLVGQPVLNESHGVNRGVIQRHLPRSARIDHQEPLQQG
jgi:hypothetical protein